jgi:phosphonatase-like hydrolase
MRKIDLIVFDLGGTIMEDHGEIPSAFKTALTSNGIDVSESDLLGVRGRSKREAIRMLVGRKSSDTSHVREDDVRRIFTDFQSLLRSLFREKGVIPISGAETLFSWLAERHVKLAVTTGFDRTIANLVLKQLSWDREVFDATICSDEVSQGRPAPYMIFRAMELTGTHDVQRVIKVGDTPVDILAGNNAGVHTVGVLTGPYSIEELREAKPTHIIPSIMNMPTLLKETGVL